MSEQRDAASKALCRVALFLTLAGCAVKPPAPSEPSPTASSQTNIPTPPAAAQLEANIPAQPWTLIWQDEFDGTDVDPSKWSHVVAGGGFGNNEHQFYTHERENAFIENGCLVIQALKKERENHAYTSAKLHTQHKGDWTYGRFEVRAKVSAGQGLWPAIWFMPTDYAKYGPWPSCGEIDLMEAIGREPETVYGTLHYGNPWKNTGANYKLPGGARFADDFHVFSLEWAPGKFEWFVDGISYGIQTDWYTSAPGAMWPAPFDRDFYLQLNLAVGGNWPGYPDATTIFPARFVVDYVRVYKFNGTYPPVEKRSAAPADLRPRDPRPDGNLIYNGGFVAGMNEWTFETSGSAKAVTETASGNLRVEVQTAGTEPWHVQLLQKPLNIERGKTYAVEFDGLAEPAREINVKVGKASQHWDNYSGDHSIALGATGARQRVIFKMRHDTDPVARVEFQVGAAAGRVVLDDVSIKPVEESVPFRVDGDLQIEAEQFDAAQGIETQPCSEGGLNVGWIEEGDWVEYNIDIAKSGTYLLRVRYANGSKATGRMAVLAGSNVHASIEMPITGDWQKWSTVEVKFNLSAGPQRLRLLCKQRGYNLNWLELAPK